MAKIEISSPYVGRYGPENKYVRYRRVVPPDVIELIGARVWVKSFRPGTPAATIDREARKLAAMHDGMIARARAGDVTDSNVIAEAERMARKWLSGSKSEMHEYLSFAADIEAGGRVPTQTALTVNAIEHGGQYVPPGTSLTAVYDRDKRLYGKDRDAKPFDYAVESFVVVIGDKDVTDISRGDVAEWLTRMEKDGLAPGTIARRLGALRALTNRAFLDFNHTGRNPFEKHHVKNGRGSADDRLPLNKKMLARVDSYLDSNKRLGHETKNIIKLMKGTGCGPAEVGGLALSDVSLRGDIPFVWIRRNAIRGVKTDVRDRRIPLLGDALEAAKDAEKRARLRAGKGHNADDVPVFASFGIGDRGADSISAKLNKAIRKAGVPKSPRLVAYSFRHTMKEALRSAGVADHVQRRLLGHAGQGVADRYGSPAARLSEVHDALQAAMGHLGDVDAAIYSNRERV